MSSQFKQPKLSEGAVDKIVVRVFKMGIDRGADNLKLLCQAKKYTSEFLEFGMAKSYGVRFCAALGLYKAFFELMVAAHPSKMDRDRTPWLEINGLASRLAWYLVRYDKFFAKSEGEHGFDQQIRLVAFKIYGLAVHPSSTSSGQLLSALIRAELPG